MLPEQDGSRVRPDSPVAVKEAVLPFKRFRTREGRIVDSILGPEMRSTGEVMGIDRDFPLAFAKSQIAAGTVLPTAGTVFISVRDADKEAIVPVARTLADEGFSLVSTSGTYAALARHDIPVERISK